MESTEPPVEPSFDVRLRNVEIDVAVIRSNYVTKADLKAELQGMEQRLSEAMHRSIVDIYQAMNRQTWRLVTFVCGFNTALVAATYYIATHVR